MLDRRVETFLQVAESGSLSKAAEALLLSAVSVKKQMDGLEAFVGTQLLVRNSQGISLTPAGEVFLERAQKLAFLSERALAQVRSTASASAETVRVGSSFLRPCKRLIDLWGRIEADEPSLHIEIVPFDDDSASMNEIVASLGKRIDCFVAPCDSVYWRQHCSILVLENLPFCLAVSKRHPLASKSLLEWDDLDGETIMMVPGDDSPIVASIREEIKARHPLVRIANCPTHFDVSVFNKCEQSGFALQTYSVWQEAHPSLVTIPVNWEQQMPYGVVYSGRPSAAMERFVEAVRRHLAD